MRLHLNDMRYRLRDYVAPGNCYHVARVDYGQRSRGSPHTHDFSEVFFVEAGRGTHLVNGVAQPLEVGDVVLIRPDDNHAFAAGPGDCAIVNTAFATDVVWHLRDRYFDGADDWPGTGGELPAAWRLDREQQRHVSRLALRLSIGRQRLIELESFLLQLFVLVTAPQRQPLHPEPPAWLRAAVRQFEAGGDMRGGVAALVASTGRSPEHVNRTVRRTMDLTTTELVNGLRLDHAAHLLRMSRQPIVAIAMASGYENLGYFYRRFKHRFGTTPRRDRLAAQALAR